MANRTVSLKGAKGLINGLAKLDSAQQGYALSTDNVMTDNDGVYTPRYGRASLPTYTLEPIDFVGAGSINILSVGMDFSGFNYFVVEDASEITLGDMITQDPDTCFVQGIIGTVIFVDDATGFAAGAAGLLSDSGGTPITINETPTINSVNTSIASYPYVIFSSTPASTSAQDILVQGTSVTYVRALSTSVGFVGDSTGLTSGTCTIVNATVGTAMAQIESVSLSSVDTSIASYNYFTMASAMSGTSSGDILVQGTTVGYVRDRLNTLIFPNTTTGFAGGSNLVSFEASVAGASVAWASLNPTTLATLAVYYKSGTGYTGSPSVSNWANQGTYGATYDLTQATGTKQPTLSTADADFNSNTCLIFDGTSDVLNYVSGTPAATSGTAFVVSKSTNDPGVVSKDNYLLSSGANSSYPSTGGTVSFRLLTSVNKATAITPSPAVTTSNFSTVTSTASDFKWYYNGNLEYTNGTNTFQFSAVRIGQDASSLFDGKFAEAGIYDSVLTDARRWMLHKYLSVKFGITLKDLD